MAKIKTTLQFVQIPSDYFQQRDSKRLIRAIDADCSGHGHIGPMVILALQMYMARTQEGYYTFYDEDLLYDISEALRIDVELIRIAILKAANLDILDSKLFSQGIITSVYIQEAYFTVMERLRRGVSRDGLLYIISPHSSVKCGDSSEECGDSSVKCGDSSKLSPCIVRNSKVKESRVCACAREGHSHSFIFDDAEVEKLWNKLLVQPNWTNKTKEALEIAFVKLNEFSPLVAAEMIKHTISSSLKEIYNPSPEMYEIAKNKAQKSKTSVTPKSTSAHPNPLAFKYLGDNGEGTYPIMNQVRSEWFKLIQHAPEEIVETMKEAMFTVSTNNIHINVPVSALEYAERHSAEIHDSLKLNVLFN